VLKHQILFREHRSRNKNGNSRVQTNCCTWIKGIPARDADGPEFPRYPALSKTTRVNPIRVKPKSFFFFFSDEKYGRSLCFARFFRAILSITPRWFSKTR